MNLPSHHCTNCQATLDEASPDGLCLNCRNQSAATLPPQDTKPSREQPTLARAGASTAGAIVDDDQPLRVVGDYELIQEIARGGMGVVYKARQRSLNRIVALKMILAGSLASDQERQRFQAEAEAAAKLDHPGIVPIYEVGQQPSENGTQHYFSMALIEGSSLSDCVSNQPMSSKSAAAMMMQIAAAVQYAHQRGIIHRDLKPGNILIDSEGRPRITDFGLAKNLQADAQLTATGQVMGTPSYMPPEQVTGKGGAIGVASDIYALGAILYCMVTGKPPFESDSLLETLTQVLQREPAAPSELVDDVEPDLETICLKCLEKQPEKRFASVQEFRDELQRYVAGQPIHSRPMGGWERIGRWRRMVQRNPDIRIQSQRKLWGIPLVAIAFGEDVERGEKTGHAKGIVAFGDRATGLVAVGTKSYGLIAYGMHARGVLAVGSTAVGIVSTGFLGCGVFSFAGISFGYFAMGFVAVGYTAIGFAAVGKVAVAAYRWAI